MSRVGFIHGLTEAGCEMSVTEYEFTIRPYVTDDREAVAALWRRVFTGGPPWNEPNDMIARKESVQPDLFLVGVLGEQIAGTVLAGFDGVRGWVHHLAVLPEFRRQGIASLLMDRAEEGLVELGCPKLNLQVRGSNAEVIAFYESRGHAVEDVISLGKPLGRWRRDPV
jgi:ribosomal protein S18 acetylase RimI-like enzyme